MITYKYAHNFLYFFLLYRTYDLEFSIGFAITVNILIGLDAVRILRTWATISSILILSILLNQIQIKHLRNLWKTSNLHHIILFLALDLSTSLPLASCCLSLAVSLSCCPSLAVSSSIWQLVPGYATNQVKLDSVLGLEKLITLNWAQFADDLNWRRARHQRLLFLLLFF